MDINKSQTIEVCKIAWRAGKKILDIYSKKFKIFKKKDMSPVTVADLDSNVTNFAADVSANVAQAVL